MAAQKNLSKYVVKVTNPETGVILYASPFPLNLKMNVR